MPSKTKKNILFIYRFRDYIPDALLVQQADKHT